MQRFHNRVWTLVTKSSAESTLLAQSIQVKQQCVGNLWTADMLNARHLPPHAVVVKHLLKPPKFGSGDSCACSCGALMRARPVGPWGTTPFSTPSLSGVKTVVDIRDTRAQDVRRWGASCGAVPSHPIPDCVALRLACSCPFRVSPCKADGVEIACCAALLQQPVAVYSAHSKALADQGKLYPCILAQLNPLMHCPHHSCLGPHLCVPLQHRVCPPAKAV